MEILKEERSMAVEMEEKESKEIKHVIGGMSDLTIPEEDPIVFDSFPSEKEIE